jgi:hypothetical protein
MMKLLIFLFVATCLLCWSAVSSWAFSSLLGIALFLAIVLLIALVGFASVENGAHEV